VTDIVSVYATFGSEEEARRIARTVVEERLAACANIFGACHSIYRWEDRIEEAQEAAAIFKTRADKASRLIARIGELHSYELPAAVVWPIAGSASDYAEWVAGETER
jgi:periplasmic divalent cation tolerance protein